MDTLYGILPADLPLLVRYLVVLLVVRAPSVCRLQPPMPPTRSSPVAAASAFSHVGERPTGLPNGEGPSA